MLTSAGTLQVEETFCSLFVLIVVASLFVCVSCLAQLIIFNLVCFLKECLLAVLLKIASGSVHHQNVLDSAERK